MFQMINISGALCQTISNTFINHVNVGQPIAGANSHGYIVATEVRRLMGALEPLADELMRICNHYPSENPNPERRYDKKKIKKDSLLVKCLKNRALKSEN